MPKTLKHARSASETTPVADAVVATLAMSGLRSADIDLSAGMIAPA